MTDSIVKLFANRSANTRTAASTKLAQEGGDLSGLFEREPKKAPVSKDKPKLDKPDASLGPKDGLDDLGGIDEEFGGGEEKNDCDEICSLIEHAECTPEDIERIISTCEEKKKELSGDDIDTEMDRPEAEMKNDMRKGPEIEPKKPLGDKAAGPGCTTSMY